MRLRWPRPILSSARPPGASGEEPTQSSRNLSRRKRWVFRLVLLAALLPIIELISWLGLRMTDSRFSFSSMYQTQDHLAAVGFTEKDRAEVMHPYLGWTLNPQTLPDDDIAGHRVPVNELGFTDDGPSLRKRSPDRLLVGFVGGSVAQQLSVLGEETLRRRLSESPRLRGKKIEFVRLALSGFKQPQQLMALSYILSLGGQLDVLVNVDGYNEVVLPACENDESGVFAAYPRGWHTMTVDIVDPRTYSHSYRRLALLAERQEAARSIVSSPLRFSATRNLLWKIHDAYIHSRIVDLGMTLLSEKETKGRGYIASGPPQLYHDREAMYRQLVQIWSDSSRQLEFLCRGNRIAYVHVLQPNQYVPGSKPIGPNERLMVSRDNECDGLTVRKAYPLLIAAGQKLRADGVRFHDLTQLFADVNEPIYADPYCHYNQKGNDLLAAAVADQILAALDAARR